MGEAYLEDPDVQLMLRVKAQDAAAFTELVERFSPLLVNFMYRYVGSRAAGEDLAQEVFVKVWRAAQNYEPKARFKTWLLTIATNVCLNRKRWEKRRSLVLLDNSQDEDGRSLMTAIESAEPDPALAPEAEEVREKVRAAIAELPEQQRAALIMSRYEQIPYVEIAETLDLSVMAVKSLLNRAKESLRKRLSTELKDWMPQDPQVQRGAS